MVLLLCFHICDRFFLRDLAWLGLAADAQEEPSPFAGLFLSSSAPAGVRVELLSAQDACLQLPLCGRLLLLLYDDL